MSNPWDSLPDATSPQVPSAGSKPWDSLPDSSTVDIKDGKVVRTHPSRMNDDEIATKILGLSQEQWNKAKQSGAYKIKSMGGKKSVLSDAFTDPEGWWGSYVVGKNKDTFGSGVNRAVQSLFAGAKKADLAGSQFAGSLVDKVYGDDGSSILREALLRANAANQNINQGRQPGKSGFDPANMAGQAVVSSAMTKGRPDGGLGSRLSANTATNFAETALTTPGSTEERFAAGGTAAAIGNVAEGGTGIAKAGVQKLFGVTAKDRAKAAARQAALERLNAKHGTNLELTAGQLSGNQSLIGKETLSESLPFGLSKARQRGNDEMLRMVESRVGNSGAELDATKFSGIDDLVTAVEAGDKNAARILRDFVENPGTDPNKLFDASKEVALFPQKRRSDALWGLFSDAGDANGPINMAGESNRLNTVAGRMEQVFGKESPNVGVARSIADDVSEAQKDIFRPKLPESVYAGGTGEFLSGSPMGDLPAAPRWELPASESTALNAANIKRSITRLKRAAEGLRGKDDELAGQLDQIVTGMDTKLEQAAAANPELRATLDAYSQNRALVYKPVRDAETALTYPGPDGGSGVAIPQAVGLEERGMAAARNQIDRRAQQQGQSYGRRNRGYIDTDKAATTYDNPAVNQFFPGQSGDDLADFVDILRATRENGQYMTNPKNGSMLRGMEMWKLLLGGGLAAGASVAPAATAGAAGVGLLSGPAARGLFNTKVGRELLLSDPEKFLGLSPELASMLGASAGQRFGSGNPTGDYEYLP